MDSFCPGSTGSVSKSTMSLVLGDLAGVRGPMGERIETSDKGREIRGLDPVRGPLWGLHWVLGDHKHWEQNRQVCGHLFWFIWQEQAVQTAGRVLSCGRPGARDHILVPGI